MLSSQSGVSESPKPGCSGTITSNFCASSAMNGSHLPAPPRHAEQQRAAGAAAHQPDAAAADRKHRRRKVHHGGSLEIGSEGVKEVSVIPGPRAARNPESITTGGDYGFRLDAEPVIGPATSGRTRWRNPE